jgi:enterochelin esterase-like enzyme
MREKKIPTSVFSIRHAAAARRLVCLLVPTLLAACSSVQPVKRAYMATAAPSPSASPLAAPAHASTIGPASPENATLVSVLGCADLAGTSVSATIGSKLLGAPMEYVVYLPPCYQDSPAIHYPVLFLLHGAGRAPDQWIALGLIQTLDREIVTGVLPSMIVLLPHVTDETMGPASIVAELLPAIDGQYRTIPDRDHRAIGGVSRGADWAVRLALGRADLFSALGLFSISPDARFWDDLPSLSRNVPEGLWPRIYVDMGLSDNSLPQAERMMQIWDGDARSYEKRLQPGEHSDVYWSLHVREYLSWFSQGWK